MSDFLQAARHTTDPPLPHQRRAWERAWGWLSQEQHQEFLKLFRESEGEDEVVKLAMPLVKEFEGCSLQAYPDPASGGEPWTIGWGTTTYENGAAVECGDRISQQQADALLRYHLARDCEHLADVVPRWSQLKDHQRAALLSFTYNCGPHWYGSKGFATLSLTIREQRLDEVPGALMLYVNPGSAAEQGLRRRRRAEGLLWAPPMTGVSETGKGNPLVVPWFSQLDSTTDQGRRMCFSSSCAMLLAFLRPGAISGANADDQYLKRVQQFGDTTDAQAQIKALASYGVRARFSQQLDLKDLERQIDAGVPVPCGYLHRGPISKPSGGGHWLIVVGYDATHLVVHDPLGEADLVRGTTIASASRFCRYSRENFGRRWMVEGPGSGWGVLADPAKP